MKAQTQTSLFQTATSRAALLFLIAWAVRLFFLAGMEAYPKFELVQDPFNDQTVFDNWARTLLAGERFTLPNLSPDQFHWTELHPNVPHQSPFYAFALAFLYKILGLNPDLVRLVQLTFGALGSALLYLVARRYLEEPWALMCGLVHGFYGPLMFYEATLLRVGPATFVLLLSLYLLGAVADRGGRLLSLSTGLSLGVLVLLRPNLLIFAVGSMAWLYWQKGRLRSKAALGAACMLALCILPVMLTNSLRGGKLYFLSSNGPYNLFIANVHDASGIEPLPSPAYYQLYKGKDPKDVHLVQELLRDIRQHPADFLNVQWRKIRLLVSGKEIPNNACYAMGLETNPRLRIARVEFHLLLPLAVMGLALALVNAQHRQRWALPLLCLVSIVAGMLPFVMISRIRLPLVPLLILFALFALHQGYGWIRQKSFLQPAVLALVAVVGSYSLAPEVQVWRATDYLMAGNAYYQRGLELEGYGDMEAAKEAYLRALVLAPLHQKAGEKVLATTGSITPESTQESARLQDLALKSYLDQNPWQSMQWLEAAVRLDPSNLAARRQLVGLRNELQASKMQ